MIDNDIRHEWFEYKGVKYYYFLVDKPIGFIFGRIKSKNSELETSQFIPSSKYLQIVGGHYGFYEEYEGYEYESYSQIGQIVNNIINLNKEERDLFKLMLILEGE